MAGPIRVGRNWSGTLIDACWHGSEEWVDKALSCVVRPDDNAIKYACQGNRAVDWETRPRIIDKLLKAKASINVGFCSACCSGDRRCVDYLIQRGANAWNQGLES